MKIQGKIVVVLICLLMVYQGAKMIRLFVMVNEPHVNDIYEVSFHDRAGFFKDEVEETIWRVESRDETGIQVRVCKYVKSNDGGFPELINAPDSTKWRDEIVFHRKWELIQEIWPLAPEVHILNIVRK